MYLVVILLLLLVLTAPWWVPITLMLIYVTIVDWAAANPDTVFWIGMTIGGAFMVVIAVLGVLGGICLILDTYHFLKRIWLKLS